LDFLKNVLLQKILGKKHLLQWVQMVKKLVHEWAPSGLPNI